MLGGFIRPTHIADFLKRQPSLVNHSTNPSFELGSGTVEVRRNYVPNPSFEDGTTTGWDSSGGSSSVVTTTAAYGTHAALWTPSVSSGNSQAMVTLIGSARPLSGRFSVSLRIPDADPATSRNIAIRAELNQSPWTAYLNETVVVTKSWQRFSFSYTIPSDDSALATSFVIRSLNGLANTPNGFLFDGVMIEDTQADLPYFDGSTNDGFDTASLTPSWTGAANNSESVLMGEGVLGASSAYGNPVWLSSDNPNHGSKFARQLVKTTSSGLAFFYVRDTQGTTTGEQITFGLNVRTNRGATLRFSATPQDLNGQQIISDGNLVLANQWTELRGTLASQNWDDSGMFVTRAPGFNLQAGDIIDIGKHFVVAGDYKGGWFSGTFSFSDPSQNTMENWRAWLRSQGAKGFKTYDLENQWLRSQSYTGTFADMFYAKFGDRDAARSFFKGD